MKGEQPHTIYRGGDTMKFDQVRREFKKTLWDEELDNDQLFLGSEHAFGPFQDNKSRCTNCGKEYGENELVIYKRKSFCGGCFHVMSDRQRD